MAAGRSTVGGAGEGAFLLAVYSLGLGVPFILAGLGVSLALLPTEGQVLILAGALLSILVNPVLFVVLDRLGPRLRAREERLRPDEPVAAPAIPELPVTALTGHTVLVGYGRVGSLIGAALRDRGEPFLVIEEREGTARRLREEGIEVILGNAGQPGLLAAANLSGAKCLVSAIPNPFEASTLIEAARSANPGIEIVARAHSDAEVEHLQQFGANRIVLGELEIDLAQRRVTRRGEPAHLTPIEFDLLLHLAGQPRTVLAREALLTQVWGWSHVTGTRTVDSHVKALRRKLGADLIRTVHGVGYALEVSR
jgi:hypothetical protein